MGRDALDPKTWRRYYTCPVTGEKKMVFMVGSQTILEALMTRRKNMPNPNEMFRKEEDRTYNNAQFRRHMEEARRVNKNPPKEKANGGGNISSIRRG